MVGTARIDRLPKGVRNYLDLHAKRPTEAVTKGQCRVAHNESGSVLFYQVMDNIAVTFVDTYYHATNVEIVRTARHSIIKQGIEVPQGMDEFNDWMGGVDTAGNLKSGHYNMEAIGHCSKWTHKMFYGLLDLTVAVCWCIYRVLHPLGDPIYMTREQFGLHLIFFFLE